jgi:phosphoribosylformimino-5-aminoimidazole carboxamide ribotide isomerase
MILYPAIDIRQGEVVRLKGGDPAQKTVYSRSPLEVAQKWLGQGARALHIINLDGALNEQVSLWPILEQIAALGVPVQFGGGLRSDEDLRAAFQSGVSRAILGTAAVQRPEWLGAAIEQYGPEAIVAGLDARDGVVAVQGWQALSEWRAIDLGRHFAGLGLRHALYTDISQDGHLSGINLPATQELAEQTGLAVIASGGLRSIEDVRALLATGKIAGVILGKALYEGLIDLGAALALVGE